MREEGKGGIAEEISDRRKLKLDTTCDKEFQ